MISSKSQRLIENWSDLRLNKNRQVSGGAPRVGYEADTIHADAAGSINLQFDSRLRRSFQSRMGKRIQPQLPPSGQARSRTDPWHDRSRTQGRYSRDLDSKKVYPKAVRVVRVLSRRKPASATTKLCRRSWIRLPAYCSAGQARRSRRPHRIPCIRSSVFDHWDRARDRRRHCSDRLRTCGDHNRLRLAFWRVGRHAHAQKLRCSATHFS